ncbi:Uncharacterised protein [Bordetella pertussis]|nr:Uncharacterised protein [Bordetella pertussis]CFO31160.1 Uncharacterised protein [Bordetella pertussis]CFU03260.1 Uncharacterised protein [Bordetella pertussis]CFW02485.1 Uncharacterised protein [Bordetella pertussis]CPJ09232.1 Uncharacterised protein [Bordetella pertussis]
MFSPSGGSWKSSGSTMRVRSGSTSTEADTSTMSVMHFMPTHTPA